VDLVHRDQLLDDRARLLAAACLTLWAGAITAGRLMAYTAALR
jgi:hypothetical protein